MPLLVLKAQQTGSEPGAYLRGHCVAVLPDGHVFGSDEGLPLFLVLQVPQVYVDTNPELLDEETTLRRKWWVDVDDLPPGVLVALESTGNASVATGVANAITKIDNRTPLNASVPAERSRILRNSAAATSDPVARGRLVAVADAIETSVRIERAIRGD